MVEPKYISTSESWEDRTRRLGVYCGYPKCCVDEFIETAVNGIHVPSRKLSGTGYVPCKMCNAKSDESLTGVINSNRKSPTLFPNIDWSEL